MVAVLEKSFALLQGILPQHTLTRLVHWFMRRESRWLKNLQIRLISKAVGIDRSEAASQDLDSYPTFNAFFTRELKADARPLPADPAALLCPSDGRISALGRLQGDSIFQAKGHQYSLRTLLADDPAVAALLGGHFWTVYLSPRDYHRVHMPAAGTLRRMIYVPGSLYSVSPLTVRRVPGLFARNERVVCIFDTEFGPMAQVLVGAMLVGSMDTVWAGTITPASERSLQRHDYAAGEVSLARGAEMGRFNMGSTVVLVTPPGAVVPAAELHAGSAVQMGMALGRVVDDV
jgi:phosphatidylserine decarboxylase